MVDDSEQSEGACPDPPGRAGADRASLGRDVDALRTMLAKTGRAWRRPALAEGALWYVVTLAAVMLSALLLAGLAPSMVPVATGWVLVVGLAAATVGAGAAWVGFQVGKRDVYQMAALLQRHHRGFRNDLVAALEFGQRLADRPDADHPFSVPMARAHIGRTVRQAHRLCEHGHLGHLLPTRPLVAPAMSLGACAALLAVPLVANADWTVDVLASPFAAGSVVEQQGPDNRPIVGDLQIYYTRPAYTGLGRTMDAFSTGYIETIVGTEVAIEARPIIDHVKQVELMIDTDQGSRAVVMEPQGAGPNQVLRGSFVALYEGSYHFRATLDDDTIVADGRDRRIDLIADETPTVAVTSHQGVVEVSPDDVLDIKFEASDDFGLESIREVWQFSGDSTNATRKALDLPELANNPKAASSTVHFDLGPLGLHPKDEIVFYVDATDNNTTTGPNTGRSKRLVLRVASPEDKHLRNIAEQQQILEQLIGLLADYLAHPIGRRRADADDTWRQRVHATTDPALLAERFGHVESIQPDQGRIIEAMDQLIGRFDQDPLMRQRDYTLFSALHQQLADLHDDGQRVVERAAGDVDHGRLSPEQAQPVAGYAGRAEDALEKGVLRFQELLASQKMAAIQASAKDIENLKKRLAKLLKKYKKTKDPALKKAIRRDIKRLRQRMNELMQRMQMQLEKLPREHLNRDAIKQKQLQSDTHKMADNLDQIEKMLQNDDIDGALKALENMGSSLDSLTKKMDQQFGNAQPKGLSELDKKVGELMDEANDVQQAETTLKEDTEKLNKELAKKRRRQIDQLLAKFTEDMRRKVARQQRALDRMDNTSRSPTHRSNFDRTRRQLDQLQEMLADKDIAQSLESARRAQQSLRRTRQGLDLSRRYSHSDDQRRRLDQLKESNGAMKRRGQQIVQDLEHMMDRAQKKLDNMDRRRLQKLEKRQRKIGGRAKKLGKKIGRASRRFPMLEKQLKPAMKQSQKAMKEAADGLGKHRSQRALDAERQAVEQLGKLKQKMKQSVQKKRRNQRRTGRSKPRQHVEIPDQDTQHAGQELRDDVMDAMKQDKLDSFESEIERYYKSIME